MIEGNLGKYMTKTSVPVQKLMIAWLRNAR